MSLSEKNEDYDWTSEYSVVLSGALNVPNQKPEYNCFEKIW